VSEETRQQAQTDVNLGRGLYADEHDVRGAIVAWERAIRRDPENAEAHLYLGQVYGQQNLNDRAEPLLRRAVALYERQAVDDERQRAPLAESRNSLAVVLTNMGRHDEAIALLRQVTQEITYGSPHLAWGNLGLATAGEVGRSPWADQKTGAARHHPRPRSRKTIAMSRW